MVRMSIYPVEKVKACFRNHNLSVFIAERGNAIAVSVRTFKVGGIRGLLDDSPQEFVTIQTAVQVALELQLRGKIRLFSQSYFHAVTAPILINLNLFHLNI